jgi:hypothetical protein
VSADILQQALRARTYFGSVAGGAGTTVPIYNSTSPTFALWNPLGSNRLIVPVQFTMGVEATGTPAIATFGFSQLINAGANYGTAAPIAAWTDGVVYNGRVGRTGGNVGRTGVATTTLTAAATFFYGLGFSQATTALAAGLVSLQHLFNDAMILEPGTAIHLVGNPAAPVEAVTPTITWYELDYTS